MVPLTECVRVPCGLVLKIQTTRPHQMFWPSRPQVGPLSGFDAQPCVGALGLVEESSHNVGD